MIKANHKSKNDKSIPNKKGQGFRMFRPLPKRAIYENASQKLKLLLSSAALTGLVILSIIGFYTSLDVTLTIGALMALTGVLAYDMASSRIWNRTVTSQLQTLIQNHDRLVREVARNRHDIAMITKSDKRSGLVKTEDNQHILELQIAPPPVRPPSKEINNQQNPLSDGFIKELLHYSVHHDSINVHIQPIVNLPQRQTQMYEVFARLPAQAGTYLTATRYLKQAHKEKLTPAIDNQLLLRCLSMLRDRKNLGPKVPYIVNVSEATLNDSGFMGDLLTFLSQEQEVAARLIFELPQAELKTITDKTKTVLSGLAKIGCRFSIDRVRDKVIDINQLRNNHISFIKLDARWLVAASLSNNQGYKHIQNLKRQLDKAGINLIAERIERENQVKELADFDINFGQGYLFGKPDIYAAYRNQMNQKLYKKG